MPALKCEICGSPGAVVTSSSLGAISTASCRQCAEIGRVPWSVLVGGLYGVVKDTVFTGLKHTIKETCEFYDKSEDDLWGDVDDLEKSYNEYLAKKQSNCVHLMLLITESHSCKTLTTEDFCSYRGCDAADSKQCDKFECPHCDHKYGPIV